MKKFPNLTLGFVVLVLCAVSVYQGQRVSHLQDCETFYRWILGAADHMRLEGTLLDYSDTDASKKLDDVVFAEIAEAMAPRLPDVPVDEERDYDQQGNLKPKLIRVLKGGENDRLIWDLARSEALAPVRERFLQALRAREIEPTIGSVNMAQAYEDDAGVNLANVFLGFRKLAANLVWLKVDRFYHQGMTYRLLPLMKTCVALDPNFVEAYQLGAWHLAYNATAHMLDTPEPLKKWDPKYQARIGEKERYYYIAADFLKDGIRKNPRDYRLYFDLGYAVYEEKLQDHAKAVKYLSEAIQHRHDRWVPRTLYRCLQYNGQYEEALAGWQSYLEQFPGHGGAIRFIQINKGLINERNARAEEAKAKQAQADLDQLQERMAALKARIAETDQAQALEIEAQALEAEILEKQAQVDTAAALAHDYYSAARENWLSLTSPQNPDSFAEAHLLMLKAKDYVEQGRYLEAIALLDQARWGSGELFDKISNIIIEYKKEGNIPLTKSEQKAVLRQQEAAMYESMGAPEGVAESPEQ